MRPRRRRPDLDRQVPRKRDERINEEIRAQNVRLVDEKGGQVGILPTKEALEFAYGKGLDLVEVAAGADPPVARVMDYSKYRYEQDQRAKQARKHQQQIHIKEIKLRPKIGVHDYETKKGHVVRFLGQRAKVKVTIMFRGRETLHPERGRDLLIRLAEDVKELGSIEQQPLLDGRNMIMVLNPLKAKERKPDPSKKTKGKRGEDAEEESEAPAEEESEAPAAEETPAEAG